MNIDCASQPPPLPLPLPLPCVLLHVHIPQAAGGVSPSSPCRVPCVARAGAGGREGVGRAVCGHGAWTAIGC